MGPPRVAVRDLFVIGIVFWSAVLLLRPFGDFPLNDDWAFAASARALVETGRLRLSDWAAPSLVTQAAWGALFSLVLGPGYGPLRLSTLVLAWLGGCAFYLSLLRSGLDRGLAGALAVLLLFNPLYFVLSPSFMTDVPFLALSLLALAISWRALRGEGMDPRWLLAGSIFSALAYGVRQNGLMLPCGITLFLWITNTPSQNSSRIPPSPPSPARGEGALGIRLKGLDRRSLAAIWALPLIALIAHQAWFHFLHGPTMTSAHYLARGTWAHLLQPGVLVPHLVRRACGAMIYCGLFVLPLALSFWAGKPLARLRELKGPALKVPAMLSAALLLFLFLDGWLPYAGTCQYLSPSGLGCFTIPGHESRGLPLLESPLLWKAASLAGWASWSTAMLAGRGSLLALFFALPLGLSFLAPLAGVYFFDRYTLPLLPAALVFASQGVGDSYRARAVLWVGTLLMAVFAWAGTADYLRAAQSSWALGEEAVQRGYKPGEVYASNDWCWAHEYTPKMEAAKQGRPLGEVSDADISLDCWKPRAAVLFGESPPSLYRPLASEEYFSPLGLRKERLTLYAIDSRAAPGR